jgi:hypothetical protein
VVGVGEQREVQALLVVELLDVLDGVRGHAHDHRAGGVVLRASVADPARLGRAPWRVGLGIEVQDDAPSA